jgi:hypothetical protein
MQASAQLPSASSMMRLIVRAQRPHCGLQPRQPYTWPAVRGGKSDPARAVRTSSSLNTLQEQMIMGIVLGGTGTIK